MKFMVCTHCGLKSIVDDDTKILHQTTGACLRALADEVKLLGAKLSRFDQPTVTASIPIITLADA